MPGKKDPSLPGASWLSDWELYRSAINTNDDLNAPATVTNTIDLRRSEKAFDNQIWVNLHRTAGSGVVTLTLVAEQNGSWAAVQTYTQVYQQAGLDNLGQHRFTGLEAANYRLLITGISSNTWDLHIAHT